MNPLSPNNIILKIYGLRSIISKKYLINCAIKGVSCIFLCGSHLARHAGADEICTLHMRTLQKHYGLVLMYSAL